MSYVPRVVACLLLSLAIVPLAEAQQRADLSITKTVNLPTPTVGTNVTFTVTVSNAGPRAANTVVVRDRLPTGYTYVSHQVTRGSYNSANGNWSLGLPIGAFGTLTLVATVKPAGMRINVSEVMSSSLPDPDSTPGNGNTAEDDYAAQATTPHANNIVPSITSQTPLPLTTAEDTQLTINLSNLSVTDPDDIYPSDFTLAVQSGTNYTVVGSNQIKPNLHYAGTLTVPVTVNDGVANSLPFNLQVNVTPVNDVPAITGQLSVSTPEDTPRVISLTQLIVTDPDDVYPADFTLAVQAGENYTISGPNEITPAANYVSALTVPVVVNDGAATSAPFPMSVTVTPVNDVPVITGHAPLSTPEDTPQAIALTHLAVTDPDDVYPDDFTLTLLPGDDYSLPGDHQVLPSQDFAGTLTISVVVNDGDVDSLPHELPLHVTAVNDVPVITGQTTLSTAQHTAVTITLPDLVVSDPDNSYPLDFALSVQSGVDYTLTGPNEITPDAGFAGELTVPMIVSDGTDSSAPFSGRVIVSSDVAPVITGSASLSTPEDTPLTVTLLDLEVSDPDNVYPDDFTLTLVPAQHCGVTPPDQVVPEAEFEGELIVSAVVNDGTLDSESFALHVTVTPVNDAPVITGQAPLATLEHVPLTITLEDLVVSDPDNAYPDDFTFVVLPGANYDVTGASEITPVAGYTGQLSVTVVVNDGGDDSAAHALDVSVGSPANMVPVIADQATLTTAEEMPLTITLADLIVTDPDNSYPTDFTMSLQPGAGYTLTGANQVTPDEDYSGPLVVPATVNDGTDNSAAFPLAVTVTPVDDAPEITGQHALVTRYQTAIDIDIGDVTVSDPDNAYPDDFALVLMPGANYDVTGAGEITPVAGFAGELTVPIVVNDGTLTSDVYDLAITVKRRPHIIVVMLDDLDTRSLDDLLGAGLMPTLQTYVVDRSTAFTEAYATTPLCCPSRATFLSGHYPHNTNVLHNVLYYPGDGSIQPGVGQFDDSVTLATRLQDEGYTTALVGKYLNGYGSDASLASLSAAFMPTYVPPGWSTWNVLVDFGTYCVYNYAMNRDGVVTRFNRPIGQPEDSATYQTNVLADLTESFVLQHKDDAAPFFLWVAPLTPHWEGCADAYGGVPPVGVGDTFTKRIRPAPEFKTTPVPSFVPTPAYNEDVADKPSWIQSPPFTAEISQEIVEQYESRLRAVLSVDLLLQRMVTALGERLDDTVIIFTSDNGWFYGEHRRAGKVLAYRESARVPLYVYVPNLTEPGTRSQMVLNNDLAPTILNLASPGYGDAAFDGRSLLPLLQPGAPEGWTDRAGFLIEFSRSQPGQSPDAAAYPTFLALRNPSTLYVESYSGWYWGAPGVLSGLERYDLTMDPYEMNSSMHFPQNSPDPVLGPWLQQLKSCLDQTCKQAENGIP